MAAPQVKNNRNCGAEGYLIWGPYNKGPTIWEYFIRVIYSRKLPHISAEVVGTCNRSAVAILGIAVIGDLLALEEFESLPSLKPKTPYTKHPAHEHLRKGRHTVSGTKA